jgi:hypothetical protein
MVDVSSVGSARELFDPQRTAARGPTRCGVAE